MGTASPSWYARRWFRPSRRHGSALQLGLCFVTEAATTGFVCFGHSANHLIWFANGVLLSYLLLSPRRLWASYLGIGFAAQLSCRLLAREAWQTTLLLTTLNVAEVLIIAFLMHRHSPALPRFADPVYLAHFIVCGALTGPLLMGSVYALIAAHWMHAHFGLTLLQWTMVDGMGVAIATPACVAILRIRHRDSIGFMRHWGLLLVLAAVSLAAFAQHALPIVFVVYPLLVLVLLHFGLGWAAMATLFIGGLGSWYTVRGEGPFARLPLAPNLDPVVALHIFIASGIFMLYTVSLVLDRRRSTERRLTRIASLHALVTENSRDAIFVSNLKGIRRYVSPSTEKLIGWSAEEIMVQGAFDLVHPDDLARARAANRQLASGIESVVCECRIRNRAGQYVWCETSLRVVRDPCTGAPASILTLVREITERKRAEQQLHEAYRALEALAVTDALTGLANRRRFDQCLGREWRRAVRDGKPLSLLLIDADYFKSYNDAYGHLQGDRCLKQIAESAVEAASRPGDLVARFGGEELAVILPATGAEGAMLVAKQIRRNLEARKLVHDANPQGWVTVSIGCATISPLQGQQPVSLVEQADQALYAAKRGGRNRVCAGSAGSRSECDHSPLDPAILKQD